MVFINKAHSKANSGDFSKSVDLIKIHWVRSLAHFRHLCKIAGSRDAQVVCK